MHSRSLLWHAAGPTIPMSAKRGGGLGGERQSRATRKKHSGGSTLATEAGLREGTFWGVEKFDGQLGKACLACLPTVGLTRFYLWGWAVKVLRWFNFMWDTQGWSIISYIVQYIDCCTDSSTLSWVQGSNPRWWYWPRGSFLIEFNQPYQEIVGRKTTSIPIKLIWEK